MIHELFVTDDVYSSNNFRSKWMKYNDTSREDYSSTTRSADRRVGMTKRRRITSVKASLDLLNKTDGSIVLIEHTIIFP